MCKSLSERRIRTHSPAPVARDHHRASASAKRTIAAIAAQAGRLATSHHNRNALAWSERFSLAPKCQIGRGGKSPRPRGVGGSAATAWLDAGVHIKQVSDLLGHSSVAITSDCYGHGSDDGARRAVDGLAESLGL